MQAVAERTGEAGLEQLQFVGARLPTIIGVGVPFVQRVPVSLRRCAKYSRNLLIGRLSEPCATAEH